VKEGPRKIGLARTLSKLGYCSRSQAALLIRAGRVTLNGKVHRDAETPVSENHDRVAIDGKVVEPHHKICLMMNKPRGVITTASDEKGRDTVYHILENRSGEGSTEQRSSAQRKGLHWVAPVGRLDKASEGLLLFTNDSEWAARISSPETHLDKTYHVQIGRVVDDEFIQALTAGVKAKDGELLRAKQARGLRTGQKNSWLEVILDEGRNRHIRRMMEALDLEVLRLIRVAIGPLLLGGLSKGSYRSLSAEEKRLLDRAMRGQSS
jgi:23S rRNA pseudouridine2605 synthase